MRSSADQLSGKKRVAIIGAGPSGLSAVKCCKDEGLEPVCYEQADDIGGLWNCHSDGLLNRGSVMDTTITNTSKEMMCFSDFPFPKEFPNYMNSKKVVEYLHLYSNHFGLMPYIRFNVEVICVIPEDDLTAGLYRWRVISRNILTNEKQSELYENVLICAGGCTNIKVPYFKGEENFQGQRMHSRDIKNCDGFKNKRVIVIGMGNSAADVAVELTRCCEQVYMSTRTGCWVIPRLWKSGLPVDIVSGRRGAKQLLRLFPRNVRNTLIEYKLNSILDHDLYGIKCREPFDAHIGIINDELPNKIATGMLIIKPDIVEISETGVKFVDGTGVDNIDCIIYATGFKLSFPFVQHDSFRKENIQFDFYKNVFPVEIVPPTIAVIGAVRILGSVLPVVELQCRWVAKVFKGTVSLPSQLIMKKELAQKKSDLIQRFGCRQSYSVKEEFVEIMDELSSVIGCKPCLYSLLLRDPYLAMQMIFGPCTPCQYRLYGDGKWPGAREAIMTTWKRVRYPFQLKDTEQLNRSGTGKYITAIVVIAVCMLIYATML